MTETNTGLVSKLYEWNAQLRTFLGDNTMYYIGIANTLILISTGSLITYVAAAASNGGAAVASSSIFGVASVACMYLFTQKYGPDYKSGIEDSLVSVLAGGIVISLLPLFLTDILELTGIDAFLSFVVSILVIILVVLISNYHIVFFAENA